MITPNTPKRGQVFTYSQLLKKFETTKYKGILWSKNHNIILLINSKKSNFQDSVNEEKKEVIYTGTGEKDQKFGTDIVSVCNSKVKDPNSVLLYFEKPTTGKYIFKYPVKYVSHYEDNELNKSKVMRRVIKFKLKILD